MISEYLKLVGKEKISQNSILCVTLLHNEIKILSDYLEHYRALGNISFIVVDDNSNDGSLQYLLKQPDVTLYQPKDGSTFGKHKRFWRRDVMDYYCDGSWCLVPDTDEHFVFLGMEDKTIQKLTEELDAEGAETILTAMLDMYADKPLSEHVYDGGGLREAFPYFDNQSEQMSYRLQRVTHKAVKKYPTPKMYFRGGMRERIFYFDFDGLNFIQKWFMRKFMHLNRSLEPNLLERIENIMAKMVIKNRIKANAYNITKLGLIKWRAGAEFSGGAHSATQVFKLSKRKCAFLHYKFTDGVDGLNYVVERGQHAGSGFLYKQILEQSDLLEQSPVYEDSSKYENSLSLGNILK